MKKKHRIIDLEHDLAFVENNLHERIDNLESQLNALETYQDFERVGTFTINKDIGKKWYGVSKDEYNTLIDDLNKGYEKLGNCSHSLKFETEKDKLLRELGELVTNSYDHWYYADKKYHIALNTGNSNYVALIEKIKALENDK